ncbi:hypothetical protein [Kitasatospora cineracea]|uniref:hypothetical protein n=1 Tax=Kitasatospora cineracea TaxID=88074 RepID=UPI0037A35279
MRPRAFAPPTVALYAAGQLPAYLLPILVGRLAGAGPAVRRTVVHPAPVHPAAVRPTAARPVVRIPEQRRPVPTAHPDGHPDRSRTARSGYAFSSARNSASRSTPDGSSLT